MTKSSFVAPRAEMKTGYVGRHVYYQSLIINHQLITSYPTFGSAHS